MFYIMDVAISVIVRRFWLAFSDHARTKGTIRGTAAPIYPFYHSIIEPITFHCDIYGQTVTANTGCSKETEGRDSNFNVMPDSENEPVLLPLDYN
jgi:hypothetical protein